MIGNWMPWIQIDGFVSESVSGADLSAGAVQVFIIGGLALVGFGVAHIRGRVNSAAMGVLSALIAGLAVILTFAQMDDAAQLRDEGFSASVGSGLLLMLGASIVAAVCGGILGARNRVE